MIAQRATLIFVCALPVLVSACASKPRAVVVLLPEQDDGTVGAATVESGGGSVDLDGVRESTRVRTGQRPAAVTTMTEAEVQRLFGGALDALPPPPRRFVVNFRFQSDELTAESQALMLQILKLVRDRPLATVAVTGHTDTMGTANANHALGLKRAAAVRKLLISAGLDATRIEVSSLGETDPIVPTRDETAEPKNRRVDITVQ